MAMKKCPVCGEKYSDTYRACPFCEEEKSFCRGKPPRRKGGSRVSQSGPSLLSPVLVIAILLMAALLVYLLFGKAIGEKLGWGKDPAGSDTPGIVTSSGGSVSSGAGSSGASSSGAASSGAASGSEGNTSEPADLTYEAAAALPDGLTLSKTDYSTNVGDPDVTLSVSGGSGNYIWLSQDDAIATVDENGKVKAVANGTVNVLATDGTHKALCIVRVKGGSAPVTPTTPTDPGPTGGSLKLGAATVINAPGGVNVRSGPGTENEAIASLVNGNDVTIKADAGNGWYEIGFAGNGGVETTGYMKGEYLKNP